MYPYKIHHPQPARHSDKNSQVKVEDDYNNDYLCNTHDKNRHPQFADKEHTKNIWLEQCLGIEVPENTLLIIEKAVCHGNELAPNESFLHTKSRPKNTPN